MLQNKIIEIKKNMFSGEIKVTQTNAILRYLGRKYSLEGKTEEDKVRVDMMLDNAMDFRNEFLFLCYDVTNTVNFECSQVTFEAKKVGYVKKLKGKLEMFSKFLGERPFFASDYVTVADFHMYEMLYSHEKLDSALMAKYPNLLVFIARMEALPKVADFLKSERSPKPMNNKMAAFK